MLVMEGDRGVYTRQHHTCKVCKRTFPCGRSLGGHMRSHLSTDDKPTPPLLPLPPNHQKQSNGGGSSRATTGIAAAANGYGLRENPKKSWRFSDPVDCHRGDLGRLKYRHPHCLDPEEQEEEEEEGSWSVGGDDSGVIEPPRPVAVLGKRKRSKSTHNAPSEGAGGAAADLQRELEDVALCLMMLSRDATSAESSDRNSAVAAGGGGPAPGKVKKSPRYASLKKVESDVSVHNGVEDEEEEEEEYYLLQRKPRKTFSIPNSSRSVDHVGEVKPNVPSGRRCRFECITCNKSFHSYQALGGHRAAHKRMKGCCGVAIALKVDGELGPPRVIAERKRLVDARHKCPICFKVFPSGQALGGHKRSHLIANATSSAVVVDELQQEEGQEEVQVIMPDLLDLNLPAPADDDSSVTTNEQQQRRGLRPWWIGRRHEHQHDDREQLVGLV